MKVGKATAVALLTPMAAATIAALTSPAEAAAECPIVPLPSASITPPSGTVTAGSEVRLQARVCGMLLKTHLQISGPGLDQQVGQAVPSGTINCTINCTIRGDVTVSEPGYFTLSVIGNGTNHTYATDGFSVQPRPAAAAPLKTAPGRSPSPTGAGGTAGNPFRLPSGAGGAGNAGGIGNLRPLNQSSPFSLPSVAPDGTGFQYPTPDPEVAAAPTNQPQARNAATTTPVSWGQSIAVALVLLLLSAHFGMWSRRQRLAAEGARGGSGPSGTGLGRKPARKGGKSRAAEAGMTAVAATMPVDDAMRATAPPNVGGSPQVDLAVMASADDADRSDEARRSSRRGYRGRRRRA